MTIPTGPIVMCEDRLFSKFLREGCDQIAVPGPRGLVRPRAMNQDDDCAAGGGRWQRSQNLFPGQSALFKIHHSLVRCWPKVFNWLSADKGTLLRQL
ncbi:hypothetical protein HDF13_003822 [Edaphobacter lichenicola]|uniref:Uncharacterized protein n=1 Tax=Tunturiibacter gelidiferens TaxID=3069689 RepID=A0ACC5P3R1_9BACT|nr:hypothetical protein [Edaphobacter lichenicola]